MLHICSVVDMWGPEQIMPSLILLLELPSALIFCLINHECTDVLYCDEEQAVQQELMSITESLV